MQATPTNLAAISGLESIGDAPQQLSKMNPHEVEEVATQFEAVFLSMLTKQLRETLDNGMFGDENSDTYGALFDLYMGQHMAESGGIGLKQMVASRYANAAAL